MNLQEHGLKSELPEVFDASMLRSYVNCPSNFYLTYCLGLQPRMMPEHPSLQWGTMWHKVMELWHTNYNSEEVFNFINNNFPPDLDFNDPKARTKERMLDILVKYVKQYGYADQEHWETIRAEQYFEIHCGHDDPCPYGGCDLDWCGRMDRIARNLKTGAIHNWDFKTTAWFKKTTFTEHKNGFQMKGYYWALKHLIQNQEVEGTIVDLLHTTKTKDDLMRHPIRWHESQIEEWVANTRNIIESIKDDYFAWHDDPEGWHKNWHHCEDFGGCMFRDVHYTPDIKDVRLSILSEDFEERRWDPRHIT